MTEAIVTQADQDRLVYIRWSEDGQHICKWAREPFEGATAFANAGNGAPLGPLDSSEHLAAKDLPFALREVAQNIHVQCADHVLEDMVRIVTDAANLIEDRHRTAASQASDAIELRQQIIARINDAIGFSERGLTLDVEQAADCILGTLSPPTSGEEMRLREALADPNAVHVNMLRGGIARPSLAQIIHIYGADALRAALSKGAE